MINSETEGPCESPCVHLLADSARQTTVGDALARLPATHGGTHPTIAHSLREILLEYGPTAGFDTPLADALGAYRRSVRQRIESAKDDRSQPREHNTPMLAKKTVRRVIDALQHTTLKHAKLCVGQQFRSTKLLVHLGTACLQGGIPTSEGVRSAAAVLAECAVDKQGEDQEAWTRRVKDAMAKAALRIIGSSEAGTHATDCTLWFMTCDEQGRGRLERVLRSGEVSGGDLAELLAMDPSPPVLLFHVTGSRSLVVCSSSISHACPSP